VLKFTKNHGFHEISRKHGNGHFSRKKANFTENVTAMTLWIRLVLSHRRKFGQVWGPSSHTRSRRKSPVPEGTPL